MSPELSFEATKSPKSITVILLRPRQILKLRTEPSFAYAAIASAEINRAQHRIFGGNPMDVANSIIAMCEGMHLLWLTSPETVDLRNDTLEEFRTILVAITSRG